MDTSLQYLTLRSLRSALADNPRGQNHFRSIGGLEVLCLTNGENKGAWQREFLGFVVDFGPIRKELNEIDFVDRDQDIFNNDPCTSAFVDKRRYDSRIKILYWLFFSSIVLAFFLLAPEDIKSHNVQVSAGRSTIPVSSLYGELSIKWFMGALLMSKSAAKSLKHYALFAFRKVLVSSPSLLDVFRAEGVWDLIFSENFFYFGPASAECFGELRKYDEVPPWNLEIYSSSDSLGSQLNGSEVDILQIEWQRQWWW
ncbi:hypothetical protein CsSME_00014138 [Camellia sinensis var. sinensis]